MTLPPSLSDPIPTDALEEIEQLAADAVDERRTAGITWAVIGGHDHASAVLAAGGAGHRHLVGGSPAPDSTPVTRATISRIASMTKSFTAASVLRLRDEGRLGLDDPIAEHVPEATGIRSTTSDAPAITVRHLLTMSAGFVTDNPWGDRQESMSRDAFAELLGDGLGEVHTPGTGFEYSNTGYALLGRLIDEVAGMRHDRYITEHFLQPLGMTDSVFDIEDADRSRVAIGHRVADREDATRFEAVPFDSPGVYGAMAGIYAPVDDVARWVRFLAAADAPDAAERDQQLLSTTSRREMQQFHRLQTTAPLPAGEDGVSPGFDRIRAYGYGLVVERFPDLGEVISHSGGYPGYGSFMAWQRNSGIGVTVLANAKGAPATTISMQILRILRRATPEALAPHRRPVAAPRTLEAAAVGLEWLARPEDAVADQWFADNMDLDTGRAERIRRRDAALERSGHGPDVIAALEPSDAEVLSPAHLRWRLPAAGDATKDLRIELMMDPRARALIQALDVTTVDTGSPVS